MSGDINIAFPTTILAYNDSAINMYLFMLFACMHMWDICVDVIYTGMEICVT